MVPFGAGLRRFLEIGLKNNSEPPSVSGEPRETFELTGPFLIKSGVHDHPVLVFNFSGHNDVIDHRKKSGFHRSKDFILDRDDQHKK